MAVLIGSTVEPPVLEAAELRRGTEVYRTQQTVPEEGNPVVVPEETTENPAAETIPVAPEEPAVKAVVRVHMDDADTEYTDIKDAWAAVNGRTAELTLLEDITTTASGNTAENSGFRLLEGNVTLDLGGHTWTYQYASGEDSSPVSFDLIEINGNAALTVKGADGSAMVYAGSSNYKGACLYATGGSTLTIEGGTFSSNVSAPVYVDGAALNVKGGIFKAAGASESAITMNNGTFSMTGGEVQVGKLTLNNTNGSQDVAIGGDSQLSGIETKGKEALTIGDTLADGYGYRKAKSRSGDILSNEEVLSGNSVKNIAAKSVPGTLSDITVSPQNEVNFSYNTDTTITLKTTFTPSDASVTTTPNYIWYENGTEIGGSNADTYTVTVCDAASGKYMDAGTYEYSVEAVVNGEKTGRVSCTITVKAVTDERAITNKGPDAGGIKTEYVYGEKIELPGDSAAKDCFELTSSITIPASVKLQWGYEWYNAEGAQISEPVDTGTYTLKVTAKDEKANYTATGEIPIEIKGKTVIPEIKSTYTKSYDGTNTVKDAEVILKDQSGNVVPQSEDEITASVTLTYNDEKVGENKPITIDAAGIGIGGKKAGNYILDGSSLSGFTATGSITKAHLQLEMDVQPKKPTVNQPVTITVKAVNDEYNLLNAGDLQLEVRGSSDPVNVFRSAGDGTFTSTYTSSTTGDVNFLAKVDTDNYDSNEVSSRDVTYINEIVETRLTLTADQSSITYGDQVTYTATVTKVGGRAGDALSGGVQFYIDGDGISNQVGSAQRITASGDTVSITMNASVLTVGNHTITARFTSDSAETSEASVTTRVAEKPVEVVRSALTLTADQSSITYGDQVTYTATVTKVGGRAGDALSGGVQFYIDGDSTSNQVGSAQQIRVSGDTASITLNESMLTVGSHTITAKFTSDDAEPSEARVTTQVAEKPVEVIRSAITVKANKDKVTYGDEVTYTATVTRVDGKDGDALSGGVQFYIDGEESSNRVGSAQTISASGNQVSVKLGRSELSAGSHRVIAVFTSDSVEGSKAEVSTTVDKKQLTWDVSGLRASKTAGTSGEVKVYGTLSVEGIIDGEVKFEQPESMKTNGFKSADAGSYKVTVVVEDGEWTFDPKEPENYELPEGDPEIKATVNALKELMNPPEATDGKSYKLVMEEGLSTVPDGLVKTSFNTPIKIENELKRILTSTGTYSEANTAVYDVTLQVSTDEGKTWAVADATNFPQGGVLVTLPYPGGTGRHTHNFAVAHMFGESLFGHTSGTVEVPAVTKTDNGLQFRVTGLSPIAVAWTDGAGGSVSGTSTSPSSVGGAITNLLGAQTGDNSPILLYAGLGAGCVLVLLVMAIVFLARRKKKIR